MISLAIVGFLEFLVILLLVLLVFLLPVAAVVDIVRHRFDGNMQLIWVLVVLLLSFVGAFLYFLVGRKQKLID